MPSDFARGAWEALVGIAALMAPRAFTSVSLGDLVFEGMRPWEVSPENRSRPGTRRIDLNHTGVLRLRSPRVQSRRIQRNLRPSQWRWITVGIAVVPRLRALR